jgi:hypothetical protein
MIRVQASEHIPSYFFALIGIYCAASLVHFTHNAEFLSAYPNLPAWLSRSEVYLSWLVVTAVGLAGILCLKFGLRTPGFLLIASYAALGFAGLDHYSVAPMSAHSLAMNATIWFEVLAAAALFAVAVALLVRSLRVRPPIGA